MEIFLSHQCESLTGSLGRGFGYYIRSTKKGRFFGQRSKHSVPPDGHMDFIWTCAQLTRSGMHFSDIRVTVMELADAFMEAERFEGAKLVCSNYSPEQVLNAKQVIDIFNSIDMRNIVIRNTKL